jgi:hypothetical protein
MYFKKILLVISSILFVNLTLFGQTKAVNRGKYRIHIVSTSKAIKIDGILDEEPWLMAEQTGKFNLVLPVDTGFASVQTVAMVTYDEKNLYVGFTCYDPTPGKRLVESLRRDFSFNKNDNCMVFLDTYNDQTNGFVFGVSAAGAQVEGMLYNATLTAYTWNAKWKSAVMSYDDRWVAEFCIPFRSIRYNEGDTEWGINFGRVDLKTTEKSVWAPVPRNMNSSSLQYHGTLIWDKPLKKAGLGFSLIPYVTGKATKDNQTGENTKRDVDAGFDAKMILSTSMSLDLTANPDYSQVEEDRQVTNLDRFELFFPERRQFFLDNSDLFANLGNSTSRPFFSRRIGLDVPVTGGGRLNGKIGDDWRLGLMDMQTGSKDETPSSNFAVAVLQKQVFGKSNIVGFLINKQITGNNNDTLYSGNRYNRVAGLEYNLASQNNLWTGKAFYHQAFYPGATSNAATFSGNIVYLTRSFKASFDQSWIGSDYIAEVGYIRRTGYFETTPGLKYSFYPSGSKVLYHGPNIDFDIIFDPAMRLTDRQTMLGYSINWKSRSVFSFNISEDYVKLSSSFDPTNTGGIKLASGSEFRWQSVQASYTSDARQMFFFTLDGGFGSYYIGNRSTIGGSVNYRVQPYGSVGVTASYNNILMPEPYNSAELILVGPMMDFTFTDKLFLTTFIQYNNQINNLNMNVRFQYRFAPGSDLFIVYTGNTYSGDFKNKNRGLALKLSYWFN